MDRLIIFFTIAVCFFFFHFYFQLKEKKNIHHIYAFVIIFLFLCALKDLFFNYIISEERNLQITFPLGLLFGPFLYYSLKIEENDFSFEKRRLFFHVLPFLIGLAVWLFLFYNIDLNDEYILKYHLALYLLIFISCFFYILKTYEKLLKYKRISQSSLILLSGFIVLLVIYCAYVFIVIYFAYFEKGPFFNEILIKITLILKMLIAFLITYGMIKSFLNNYGAFHEVEDNPLPVKDVVLYPISNEKYKDVQISIDVLRTYHQSFENFLLNNQAYLSPQLSLDFISRSLKIPSHHLTQMINRFYNMNLQELLNHLKINHSCKLLRENKEISISELAFLTGFSSESAFFRNFKVVKKMTTSEYRKTIKA